MFILLCLFSGTARAATPVVNRIQNNYSYLLPGQPNYGIAQGSIFIVVGTELASSSTPLQNAPLPTTLAGVTVTVTVSGTTTTVILYYVTPGQLGGILPSATPAGDGTLVVNNNGDLSEPAPIHVVPSAFGLLTLNGTGAGRVAVFDQNFAFLSDDNPTQVGERIFFYGSGLGAVDGDETIEQIPADMAGLNIVVKVGGQVATVEYRGRSTFPGLDQINIIIPEGVLQGCTVTISVTVSGVISNFGTIPVGEPGATSCGQLLSSDLAITQEDIDAVLAEGEFRRGSFGLTRSVSYAVSEDPNGVEQVSVFRNDFATASYSRITGPDLPRLFTTDFLAPIAGSCIVTSGFTNPLPGLNYEYLDVGEKIDVMGPAGMRSALRGSNSVGEINYYAEIGDGSPGNFLDPGRYTVTGYGGPDGGAFQGSWNVASELIWTNREQYKEVNRDEDMTLTWTGGNPSTLVSIQASSTVTMGTDVIVVVILCYARNSDGQFTITSDYLKALPASQILEIGSARIKQRGSLSLATVGTGTRVSVPGLHYATLGDQVGVSQSAFWK